MINVENNIFGKKRVKTFFDRQDEIQKHIGIPILNIIDAAADQIKARGFHTIGLLGCTEIPLLVHEEEGNIPLFDTTLIHSTAAVEYALP